MSPITRFRYIVVSCAFLDLDNLQKEISHSRERVWRFFYEFRSNARRRDDGVLWTCYYVTCSTAAAGARAPTGNRDVIKNDRGNNYIYRLQMCSQTVRNVMS